MSHYKQLAECIRSGQLTAAEIRVHMQDEVFRAWYSRMYK